MTNKPRSYAEFRTEEAGALKETFANSNPEYWAQLLEQPEDIERAIKIVADNEDARRALSETFQEERQERIAQKAADIFSERAKHHEYVAPEVAAHIMAENSILEEAAKRVDEDHKRDMQALKDDESEALQRLADSEQAQRELFSKKEIETVSNHEKSTHFKAELHKLIDDANEARVQVGKLMNSERPRMIEEAKARGAQDPLKEVKAFQGRMYRDVQDRLHGDIHALCIKYGYSPDQQNVAFYAQYPERVIGAQENGSDQGQGPSHEMKSTSAAKQQASSKNQGEDQEQ